ncbi:MAG TPA: carbohydrate ABC transporter permease [Chloroflexota bacterium]|nr:carbohydrate ABC transporter permease [Chloroflexota bacterium]
MISNTATTRRRWTRILPNVAEATIVYILLAILVVVMLLPYAYILSSSFKDTFVLISIPPELIPDKPTFDNYVHIAVDLPLVRWFINSVVVAVLVTLGNVLIDALTAYVFARKQFFGRDVIFSMLLATVMIPSALLLIPSFLITNTLGLVNTYAGIIIPSLGGVVGVFLLRQFMESLPVELEHAARIDGCSELRVFWSIILPLSKPALGTLAILVFTGEWNSLVWPLVVVESKDLYTLPLGLALLSGEFQVNYGVTSAAAFISVVPLMLVFLFLQRYFMEGLTVGAIKG